MDILGGWSKTPHAIIDAMPEMSLAELACTLLLLRETVGWQRRQVRLTQKDFCARTAVKSRVTVSAALKAVEARGFFRRTGERSVWQLGQLCEDAADQGPAADGEFDSPALAGKPAAAYAATAAADEAGSLTASDIERRIAGLKGSIAQLEQSLARPPAADSPAPVAAGQTDTSESSLTVGAADSPRAPEDKLVEPSTLQNSSVSDRNRSIIEVPAAKKGSESDQNGALKGSISDPKTGAKGSNSDPFHYYKERSPAGAKRERERKGKIPHTPVPALTGVISDNFLANVPRPRSPEEQELAAHPATAVWLGAGLKWPGWERLKLISLRLGPQPQEKALRKARELWLMSGYREGNIAGILDWYGEICADPAWAPYGRRNGQLVQRPSTANGTTDPTMAMLLRMREEAKMRG